MDGDLIIKQISTKEEIKKFIEFPDKLYSGEKKYVPAIHHFEMQKLIPGMNPAFEFCRSKYWLVLKSNMIVGRIAGIINEKYNEKHNVKAARFGFIDFINDSQVVKLLLQTVENWAKENLIDFIHGPLGFTSFDQSGVLIEGYDELPTTFGRYNYPYYSKQIEKAGYIKDIDWIEFNIKVPKVILYKQVKTIELIKKRYNLKSIKPRNKDEILRYTDDVFHLINSEYSNIYSFTELTEKQIIYYKKQIISFIKPELISIILNNDNEVVGFGITVPSMARAQQKIKGKLYPWGILKILNALKHNDTVDALLIAVHKDYRKRGLNGIIFYEIIKNLIKMGVKNIESNREMEANYAVTNLWNKLEYRQHKRARCYYKKIIY